MTNHKIMGTTTLSIILVLISTATSSLTFTAIVTSSAIHTFLLPAAAAFSTISTSLPPGTTTTFSSSSLSLLVSSPNYNLGKINVCHNDDDGIRLHHRRTSSSSFTSLHAIRRGGGRRPDGGRKTPEFIPKMNNDIKNTELRVNISTKDGKDESLGIMTKAEALAKAKELGGLDLILINENSDPPVCKIVDYSKYRYSLEKKRKEKAKNSKATEMKEVKMSYIIGDHDYDVRLRAAAKFLRSGNRVKATIQFRGREVQHDNLGVELLVRLAGDLEAIANMEGKPRREGRTLGAILSPRAEVVKALNDAKRLKEREKKKAKAESLAKRVAADNAKLVSGGTITIMTEEDRDYNRDEREDSIIGDLFDGINLEEDEDDDDDDDDEFDDTDFDDADLDELLGSSKVADDLFT